jgi:hypothetical protein
VLRSRRLWGEIGGGHVVGLCFGLYHGRFGT